MGDVIDEDMERRVEQRLKRFSEKEKERKAAGQKTEDAEKGQTNSQIPAVISAAL